MAAAPPCVLGRAAALCTDVAGAMPGMVSDTELERLRRQVHGATPARMRRELGHALAVLAADTPLVLVLEDLRR